MARKYGSASSKESSPEMDSNVNLYMPVECPNCQKNSLVRRPDDSYECIACGHRHTFAYTDREAHDSDSDHFASFISVVLLGLCLLFFLKALDNSGKPVPSYQSSRIQPHPTFPVDRWRR